MSKRLVTVALAMAVASALIFIPLTAGSQEGRSSGATAGPATAPAEGGTADSFNGWDGDGPAPRDQVILDDLIVDGSACIGQDCVNGESFGFDTLRLKENNLRIKAEDTSNSASFPTNDWQITFNESTNGGAEKFSIDDISGSRTPFTIEAGARTNALYVDDGGRIGIGTSTPTVNLHVKTGNTPTLRLEQDGTSGFTPQTWDLAGNEANFFIRDASSGSTLPLRIFPGAPSNALTIEGSTGDIGIGTTSPEGNLHVRDNGVVLTYVQSANNDAVQLRLRSDSTNRRFLATNAADGVQSQIVFGASAKIRLTGASDGAGNGAALLFTSRAAPSLVGATEAGAVWVDDDGSLCFLGGSGTAVDLGGGTVASDC